MFSSDNYMLLIATVINYKRLENVEWPTLLIFFYLIQMEKATFNLTLFETDLNRAQRTHSVPIQSYTMLHFIYSCVHYTFLCVFLCGYGQRYSTNALQQFLISQFAKFFFLIGQTL